MGRKLKQSLEIPILTRELYIFARKDLCFGTGRKSFAKYFLSEFSVLKINVAKIISPVIQLYIYAYWADAYYTYILVRIYLSCTVGEVSGVEIKRREEDEEKIEGSKKYCFVCRKKSI